MTAAMPSFGISLLAGGVGDVAQTSVKAEAAGYDTAWTAEFYNRTATITLAAMAERTGQIRIGSGIAYAVGRSPLILAAEARDIDELSGGRLVLGLGTGTKRMMESWHGADPASPALRIEELVPLLRRIWRLHEGPVKHEGRFYSLDLKATAEMAPPLRAEIPVFTAGVNPRMIETAGRVANGFLGHPLFTRSYVEQVVRPQIAKGAAKRERDAAAIEIAGVVICSVDQDEEAARRNAAAQLAFYAAPKTYEYALEVSGFAPEGAAIRAAFAAGDYEAMVAAVSDQMIDEMCLAGTVEQVSAGLSRYAGVLDHMMIYPPSWRLGPDAQAKARDLLLELRLEDGGSGG